MNTCPRVLWPFFCLVLAIVVSPLESSAQAAPRPGWQETTVQVDVPQRELSVTVPSGATRLALEFRTAKGKWVRWKTFLVLEGQTELTRRLRPALAKRPWRAWAEIPGTLKFPAKFYRGKTTFARAASAGYGEDSGGPRIGMNRVTGNVEIFDQPPGENDVSAPVVEADIWKADGTTVFFFNQLRGLQVIDLSNPSAPTLVAALRLPAVGQDLYVLPAAGSVQHAVLLARDPSDWDATLVHLVRVEGAQATLVSSLPLAGSVADSRMKGRRLFVATQQWEENASGGTSRTLLHEVFVDAAAGTLAAGAPAARISGHSSVVAAGDDWMAVASNDWNDGNTSRVLLFSLDETGLRPLNTQPIRTAGRVADKFKMQVRQGVFTAITEGWDVPDEDEPAWWAVPVTRLENYRVAGQPLAELEIIRGEQLFATRFAGDKAYAVTFEGVDPLWVIDLTDPAAPAITGHLEVPGWSTHIEPLGDLLFSIGWDEGRVAASLFDVSDAANPTLASRVFLSEAWDGFSESLYDEKALKILADRNLVLVPFSLHTSAEGDSGHRVQLLQIDPATKTLTPRGRIAHGFEPRRSAMVGAALASISQRQIVTSDISDPDQPVVLADLLLAWPANRVVISGDYLLQIADGSAWSNEPPVLRVSPAADPEDILREIPLGSGIVHDAAVRGNKLHVLRTEMGEALFPWSSTHQALVTNWMWRGPWWGGGSVRTVHLDTYDISLLPEMPLLGSVPADPGSDALRWETGRLLFPGDNTAVVLARSQSFGWWFYPLPAILRVDPVAGRSIAPLAGDDNGVANPPDHSSRAFVFDLEASLVRAVDLPAGCVVALDHSHAADGLVVFGCGERVDFRSPYSAPRKHYAAILDAARPEAAVTLIDLPGQLRAVTDLDRRGFLAWTETVKNNSEPDGLQVSACDLQSAYLVASIKWRDGSDIAVQNRTLYTVAGSGVRRHVLTDTGVLAPAGQLALGWQPYSLRVQDNALLASDGTRLARTPIDAFPGTLARWISAVGIDLSALQSGPDGALYSPAGDFGVDVFR